MNNDVLPEYRDVQRAAERLEGVAHVTPVMDSKTFDELTGAHVVFKCEHLQRMGAFKFAAPITRWPPIAMPLAAAY